MKRVAIFLAVIIIELILALGGFGVSAYLYAQVPDHQNVLSMVPLCFMGYAVFVTILGALAGKCHSHWLLLFHLIFGFIAIIGFCCSTVISGMWLGSKTVLPISNLDNSTLTSFREICNLDDLGTDLDEIEANNSADSTEEPFPGIDVDRSTVLEYMRLFRLCDASKLASDIILGRTSGTSAYVVNIILALCVFSGTCFIFYTLTFITGVCFINEIKTYGWSA